jgi:ribosomal protein S6--L-glutamate ligase
VPASIIRDNKSLFARYEELVAGDIVVGRIRLRTSEEGLITDLIQRGIHLVPSGLSQLCSRSKVLQAQLLKKFMGPGTCVVHDHHDMQRLVGQFRDNEPLVCKLDRANGGTGIFRFPSIEDVYTQSMLGSLAYPFVLQPFYAGCRDVRVVMLGDVREAYERHNSKNFRHNLHFGGTSRSWPLDPELQELCERIMNRAGFPYAHLDFLISADGDFWLSEINLRGGLRGAELNQGDYLAQVEKIHAGIVDGLCEQQQESRGNNPVF